MLPFPPLFSQLVHAHLLCHDTRANFRGCFEKGALQASGRNVRKWLAWLRNLCPDTNTTLSSFAIAVHGRDKICGESTLADCLRISGPGRQATDRVERGYAR